VRVFLRRCAPTSTRTKLVTGCMHYMRSVRILQVGQNRALQNTTGTRLNLPAHLTAPYSNFNVNFNFNFNFNVEKNSAPSARSPPARSPACRPCC
jgi:hypothetical protein